MFGKVFGFISQALKGKVPREVVVVEYIEKEGERAKFGWLASLTEKEAVITLPRKRGKNPLVIDLTQDETTALYFELERGRHITWGQGRHDIDEWPRLTEESLRDLRFMSVDPGFPEVIGRTKPHEKP